MSRGQKIVLSLAGALNLAVLFLSATDSHGDDMDGFQIVLLIILNIILVPLTALGWVLFDARRWKHLEVDLDPMVSLTKYDVKDVGRLIEGLRYGNRHTRAMTQDALVPLMPRLLVSDASRFEARHLEILCTAIKQGDARKDWDFLLAAFVALEKIGDETTITFLHSYLHTVRPLHKGGGASERTVVQDAARNCLEVLESRKQAEARRLLRASDAPGQADTLLRPAGQEGGDRRTLLRPVHPIGETAEDEAPSSLQRR